MFTKKFLKYPRFTDKLFFEPAVYCTRTSNSYQKIFRFYEEIAHFFVHCYGETIDGMSRFCVFKIKKRLF